jgi:crossover junction endodeoxyribonuclease RuvC
LGLWKPDLAVVEGFAYHNHNTLATLVECGTIFRRSLFKAGIPWMEVSPTTLKKWTTGNGAASKDLMAGRVYERWSYRSPSNDIVDAYALAQMGQLGLEKLASITGVNHGS